MARAIVPSIQTEVLETPEASEIEISGNLFM
jgi:hypothetical protein